MGLFDSESLLALKRGLNVASLRQQAIADNLANANVPGYKRKEVNFEEAFQMALGQQGITGQRTDIRHIPIGRQLASEVRPAISRERDVSLRVDGNNVDIDVEMADLAENEIRFQSLAQMVAGRYNNLRNVIREGR